MCKPGKGLIIKNIILDRDGTLIEEKNYLSNPEDVVFIDGAFESLKSVISLGIDIFIVTNQSGIGRGYFTLQDYLKVKEKIHKTLNRFHITIKDEVFCPHAPEEECKCRKPNTGLWEILKKRHGLKAEHSIVIGDKLSDIEFGARAGIPLKILVLTGHGEKEAKLLNLSKTEIKNNFFCYKPINSIKKEIFPDIIAKDLPTAISGLKEILGP